MVIWRTIFTARKRSLRRLCFYRCLSFVHRGVACMVALGGHAWLLWGGMHGCSRGCAWLLWGHAWLLWGACMVARGGMCGCSGEVHGFSEGACVVFSMRYSQWAGGTHPTGMHSGHKKISELLFCGLYSNANGITTWSVQVSNAVFRKLCNLIWLIESI